MSDQTLWVKLESGHSDATVTKILVTGTATEYPTTFDGAGGLAVYFHWQLFLHLREFPAQGVVMDMTPGADGRTGLLMVSSKVGLRSASQVFRSHEVKVLGSNPITVQGLVDELTSGGLTRYRFNDQGMGCRWWCEVSMQKLEDNGYVEEGTVADLDQWWLDCAAHDPRIPSAKIKGSFY